MWRPIPAAALATALLLCPGAPAAESGAPWFGAWTLDLAGSRERPGQQEYRRITCRIEPWADGLRVTYDMVGMRGGRTHIEWTGKLDGRDYPVQGVDYVMTNAYSPIDANTYEILVKVDGQPAARTRVSISTDGKVLTAVTTETNARGGSVTTTAVYDRQ